MEVGKYISDGKVLKLIESYLEQDIMDGLKRWTPGAGTPQGAVISEKRALSSASVVWEGRLAT